MDAVEKITRYTSWMPRGLTRFVEKRMKKIGRVRAMIDQENDKMMGSLEASLKPYKGKYPEFGSLPLKAKDREEIFSLVKEMSDREQKRWEDGYVSGGIYHGDAEHIAFMNRIYALQSQTNPLHSDLFPSTTKFEAEIISMVAHMLGKNTVPGTENICGTVTSGGTESILMAMKTYRDQALEERGIERPELVLPETAHTAFDKAGQYFGIKLVKIPVGKDFAADARAMKAAINRNTIAMVGSAPCFPHGIVDPIETFAGIALEHGIGFHTDACLGGFVLAFAGKAGYAAPAFDFKIPGVTSISIDTHKYGYAAKGTSVLLYRDESLRHYQFFTATDWPGGLYHSPTMAGSRPGGLSAACWAAMLSIGQEGYVQATKAILETADQIKEGIRAIPELKILGDPLWIPAIASDKLNIYEVMDHLSHKGWSLNGLQKPACFHIALTLRHTRPGVAERFLQDLREAVAHVKAHPGKGEGMAPVYGMASSLPFRGMVSDILKKYLDVVYKV